MKYIVAFTEEFCKQLDLRGFKQLGALSNLRLSEIPNGPLTQLALYELPWQSHIIVPETEIRVFPSEIWFSAFAGQSYILRYSTFLGWRGFQLGKRVEVTDARPGMVIKAEHDGEIVLRYSYRYYWF